MKKPVRIIARLDIKGPNLIKGIGFEGFRTLGHPWDFAKAYSDAGIDEIVVYDTVASLFQRPTSWETIEKISAVIDVPLTVVGGLASVADVERAVQAGADRIGINTAAVKKPEIWRAAADLFGSQSVIASIETFRHMHGVYDIWTEYGRAETGLEPVGWAALAQEHGAGELMVTSIDRDGTGTGYDLAITRRILEQTKVPVIVGGGPGRAEHIGEAIRCGVDAVCIASMFHYELAKPLDRQWNNWTEPRLRMGDAVDSGNIDFLNSGYGHQRELPVETITVAALKAAMDEEGFEIRAAA